jgi:hypothetical protein
VKCSICGAENPEHVTYCGSCGEVVSEPSRRPQTGEEMSTYQSSSEDSDSWVQGESQPKPARLPPFSLAAFAALIGLILLTAAFAIDVYFYEEMMNPERTHSIDEMFNVAKIGEYLQIIGYLSMALAILLLVRRCLDRQRYGTGLLDVGQLPLRQIRYLAILALLSGTISFGVYFFVTELQLDLSVEVAKVLSRVVLYLPDFAWVCMSILLLLVARHTSL